MKNIIVALRCLCVLTLITGILYPALITFSAQVLFPRKANGSLLTDKTGKVIGSELLAQNFKETRYFWPRPSAVDYNPLPSGGTNLGPSSKALQEKWAERQKAGLSGDMLAASASGLDPHVSPESALLQIARVASARGISREKLEEMVLASIEPRQLGFLGESRVNILKLNLLLDERMP